MLTAAKLQNSQPQSTTPNSNQEILSILNEIITNNILSPPKWLNRKKTERFLEESAALIRDFYNMIIKENTPLTLASKQAQDLAIIFKKIRESSLAPSQFLTLEGSISSKIILEIILLQPSERQFFVSKDEDKHDRGNKTSRKDSGGDPSTHQRILQNLHVSPKFPADPSENKSACSPSHATLAKLQNPQPQSTEPYSDQKILSTLNDIITNNILYPPTYLKNKKAKEHFWKCSIAFISAFYNTIIKSKIDPKLAFEKTQNLVIIFKKIRESSSNSSQFLTPEEPVQSSKRPLAYSPSYGTPSHYFSRSRLQQRLQLEQVLKQAQKSQHSLTPSKERR